MLSESLLQIVIFKLKGLLKNFELLFIAIATLTTNTTKPTRPSCLGGFVVSTEKLSTH
jgi:hypothetical protein